jgi:hypothetical protein
MRVVCIHLPKESNGPGSAFYKTKWETYNWKFFSHQLDELAETLWEPFSLEMYASGRSVHFCLAGEDNIVDNLVTGVYSWLGDSQILDIDDYTEQFGTNTLIVGADVRLTKADVFPIQSYDEVLKTDSLVPILMPLQQLT